ncbi:hypothetical protein [Burkholderia pyrrocinia]|uniref:hypothetical protein n=1 Tax=Burkholderia pyrrocinia TaxID=60550 RepID=UPI001BCC5991|nr:hypothetical protein [Burkholderia pyrrocinia]QVN18737.1 hypothetical protein JYG32_03095 [Burkholderia pyrrocinia]
MSNRVAAAAGVIEFFMGRTDFKALDKVDLLFLTCAGEQAVTEATNLSRIVTGLGCLISEDQTRDGAQSGALWDDDLPSVLWNIANQIDAIGQLTFVASEADYELRRRAEEGAKEVGHG